VSTVGNSIDGDQTITTTGDRIYSVSEDTSSSTNNGSTGGSGGLLGGPNVTDDYGFTETGSNPYTRTEVDNANDGQQNTSETGTDTYSISEGGDRGTLAYSGSLTGVDTYTMTASLNTQTGGFSLVTSGTDNYTNGDDSGSNPFTTTETGNSFAGSVSLTNTGTNRYDLVPGFNNTSDGANGGFGAVDFSPVGTPILIGRASVPAGTFTQFGDVAHKYCFAKGTMIRMADGSSRPIETIEPGTMVLAAPENDPEAAPTSCRVREIYHNHPAEILNVTAVSSIDPLNGDLIRTTAGHPFYVREKGWIKADDLRTGDQLRTSDGGWTKVRTIVHSGSVEPVFNLHVEDSHTYFVSPAVGAAAVLVHNDSTPSSRVDQATPQQKEALDLGAKLSKEAAAIEEIQDKIDDYWANYQQSAAATTSFSPPPTASPYDGQLASAQAAYDATAAQFHNQGLDNVDLSLTYQRGGGDLGWVGGSGIAAAMQAADTLQWDHSSALQSDSGPALAVGALATDGLSLIAEDAAENAGTTVIGHYPDYVNLAQDLKANYFSIPTEQWNAMTEAEQWAANQKFLDEAIARGDTFRLATPIDQVRPGSYLEKEIQYLTGKGFQLNGDGSALVPPGR